MRGPSPDCHRDQASDVSGYPGVQRTPPHRGIICRGMCHIYFSHADRREACGSAVACFGCVPVFFCIDLIPTRVTVKCDRNSSTTVCGLWPLPVPLYAHTRHGKRHQWNTHVTCHVTQTHRTPKYYSTAQILFLFFFPLPAKWAIRWHTFQIKNIEYCTDCKRDTACPLRSGKRMTMRYDMIETHAQRGHVYMYEDVL